MSSIPIPNTDPVVIEDVWSRTSPKYRRRAVILLITNMLLFGALCCFMFWLRTGWYFPPTYEGYTRIFYDTFNIMGGSQITPHDLLLKPISLKLVPMHAVVVGLLISSLVSIPIVVTILYRLPCALPFCAMVAFLAVMPWLGLTLLLSCMIAAAWRFKIKFRFAAALLALLPIGIYFFSASQRYSAPSDVLTPQIERGLVVIPLLLSAIASCMFIACVLFIARIVNYRPGAITPLLTIMFLTPWILFLLKVGRDELHYRFLEQHYGPNSREYFAETNAGQIVRQVATRLWLAHEPPRPDIEELTDRVRKHFEAQLTLTETDQIMEAVEYQSLNYLTIFAQQKLRIAEECQKYLDDFRESSRYVPNVLYIKGRALDMRIDLTTFQRYGQVRYYSDFPSPSSRSTWKALLDNYPQSPLSAVSRHRLALLEARNGNIDQAVALLENVERSPESAPASQPIAPPRPSLEKLLEKKPPEASLQTEYANGPLQNAALLSLLRHNREPLLADAPLIAYLSCDPLDANYHQNLTEIIERYPTSKLLDNIQVQLALTEKASRQRIAQLEAIRRTFPDGDAQPEILYELGRACLEDDQLTEARLYFDQIVQHYPESSFAAAAHRRLPVGRLGGER